MNNEIVKSNIGPRVIATIIDYILIFSLTLIYVYEFGEPSEKGGYHVSGLKGLVPIVFWFLYLPFAEWKFGSTLGHWTVGLKIIAENDEKLTLGKTIKRRLSDIIDISWCFGLVAFIMVKSTDKKQRCGDIIAKTLVIKR